VGNLCTAKNKQERWKPSIIIYTIRRELIYLWKE